VQPFPPYSSIFARKGHFLNVCFLFAKKVTIRSCVDHRCTRRLYFAGCFAGTCCRSHGCNKRHAGAWGMGRWLLLRALAPSRNTKWAVVRCVIPKEVFDVHNAVFRVPHCAHRRLKDFPVGGIVFPSGVVIGTVKVPCMRPTTLVHSPLPILICGLCGRNGKYWIDLIGHCLWPPCHCLK
jgi:hypothetical protein